jgi:putative hydrolase of the HAD superfamily
MIKAAFFDFDGVLTLEGNGREAICSALSTKHNIPFEQLEPTYNNYTKEMNLKPIRYASVIGSLNEALGSHITVDDILEAAKTAQPNQGMLDIAERLRQSGLITGIITDNKTERIEALRETFELSKFHPIIISSEVGHAKWQNSKIFEHAIAAAEVQSDESLFIDNTGTNLPFAAELGMNTYLHNHETNDLEALGAWLTDLTAAQ